VSTSPPTPAAAGRHLLAGAAGWLTPTSASGTGCLHVRLHGGRQRHCSSRSSALTIVGQDISVNQSGPGCATRCSLVRRVYPAQVARALSGVVTAAGCGPYTAASNVPLWCTSQTRDPTPDSASANYSVDANLTGSDRLGSITIAGQPFTLRSLRCRAALR